ncbi:TetR/AcrR family transcriptional regulator [Fodinicola feengrottensis]|uniref:TetR/AcrR family transcriptional regulator n=1 Tax=Fodinicola feengrottensis TaxID=435914 RepID=UPI0013CF5D78|nr:TetR family transcriptional regulator [Fodinicola feengrottensis]
MSAQERRHELIEAAIRVMARDGVAKATTRAIVTEAGMQLGFFHYCFRSKEELLLQVIDTINERNVHAVIGVVRPHSDLRETLRASVGAYWEEVEANPGVHQLTYELTQYALRRPELIELTRRQYANYFRAATGFLEAVAAAAGVEWTVDLPLLARYTYTIIDGATLSWVVDRDGDSARQVLDQFTDYLVASARQRQPTGAR